MLIDCHNGKTLVVKESNHNRGKCDTERANENLEEKHGNRLERGKKLVNKSRLVAVCFCLVEKFARVFWANHRKVNVTKSLTTYGNNRKLP